MNDPVPKALGRLVFLFLLFLFRCLDALSWLTITVLLDAKDLFVAYFHSKSIQFLLYSLYLSVRIE